MVTYKGLPAPIICDYLSREASRERYAPGTEFQIGKIEMVANTGTYVDSPFHRYPQGKDLAGAAARVAGQPGVRGGPRRRRTAGARSTGSASPSATCAAGRCWCRPDGTGTGAPTGTSKSIPTSPASSPSGWSKSGAVLVGIDSFNIDSIDTGERPVHSILLGHDIPIVEHMCGLAQLPERGARFFAVPVKVTGFGTFPVRAFAIA